MNNYLLTMKRKLLAFLCFPFFLSGFSQALKHDISYFSTREYGKGHEAANWACVQDKNGVLYFGNAGGLLQYDGANWNFISVKQKSVWVKTLAISDKNIIYIGAQNEFGYLAPNNAGVLSYNSLSNKLEDHQKIFSNIIRVWTWEDKVLFQSEEAVFLYHDNQLTTILPQTSFHLSFLVYGELYVRQRDVGLMKLTGNEFQLAEGSVFFKNIGISSIIESSDPQKLLVITREDGFWSIDKDSFLATKIVTPDEDFFMQSEIYGAINLTDGKIALNTLSNGIIITDENFNISEHINKNNGLKVNGALSLMQDYQGNIWAGLDNGIAQLRYSSPFSIFGAEAGISGNISAIERHKGKLYVGTTEGLFIEKEGYGFSSTAFAPAPGFTKEIRNFCIAGNSLLAGTQDGLFEIHNNQLKLLADGLITAIYYSENLELLFVARKDGLELYRDNSSWRKIGGIPEIEEKIIRFEESTSPHGSTIWMGTALEGVIRLKFKLPFEYVVDKYYASDGLTNNSWVLPFKINEQIVFSQYSGLMQFVDEEVLKVHLPDSLKNLPEFNRGYFDFFHIDSLENHQGIPLYTLKDTKDRIYANLDGDLGYFDKSNSNSWISQPFCLADIGKSNVFFYEENGICWIGGDDGLIRFDEQKSKDYKLEFRTLLTKVTCSDDSILYSGYGGNNTTIAEGNLQKDGLILDFSLNTVGFYFAAPFFEGQEKIVYSSMLLGHDKIYGPWLPENKVLINNLREGDYTFVVRAKNAYGHISSESNFSFTISAPWYRTILAYILYILALIVFVYTGIRINSRRLIEKNKKLEGIILERTQEIKQKNIVLEHQKQEILDSINYALRIQKAVLPDNDLTKEWLGEHFILFRPKDIVSGDFYWATRINENVFFCVADCTGHGVPGAFMSMLCISFLNEVILKERITQSDEICNRLRTMIIESLKQKGISGEQKDGMDITMCILNTQTLLLQHSGANNPLYIIRSKDRLPVACEKQQDFNNHILYEVKGDAMPIAIHVHMAPFKRNTIQLFKDDRLYLFSDGIADQFGGPAGKKFMYKNFKNVLMESCTTEMENQQREMEQRIDNWMDSRSPEKAELYDQVDDICLMGIRI